jgi:hypothetical protein
LQLTTAHLFTLEYLSTERICRIIISRDEVATDHHRDWKMGRDTYRTLMDAVDKEEEDNDTHMGTDKYMSRSKAMGRAPFARVIHTTNMEMIIKVTLPDPQGKAMEQKEATSVAAAGDDTGVEANIIPVVVDEAEVEVVVVSLDPRDRHIWAS